MKSSYRFCAGFSVLSLALVAVPGFGAELELSGVIQELRGEAVVLRGVQTRTLAIGDKVFLGDRIITRSGGQVGFAILDCQKTLGPVQSIFVDEDICAKQAIALVAPAAAGAAFLPTAGGAVASSPALFVPLLATGGAVTTAAALTSGNRAPVSP